MSLHMAMSSAQATLARFDMYSECLPFTSTDALGTSGGLLIGEPASTGSTGWDVDDDDRVAACSPRSTTSGSCYSSGSPFTDYYTSEEDLENIDLDSLQTIRRTSNTYTPCPTNTGNTQGALLQGYVSSRMEQFLRSPSTTPPPLSTTPPSTMMTADPAPHNVHTHRYPLTLTGSTYTHTGMNFRNQHQQQQPGVDLNNDLRKICGGGVKKASTGNSKPNKEVLRKRRLAANERERRRMNSLNVAFDHLRGVVPGLGGNQQLSKYDTLQMAQTYIRALQDILKKPLP